MNNMEWISVEDRMPNIEDEYLVVSFSGVVTTMDWMDSEWVSNIFPDEKITTVTHWMPLPEPPKK